MRLTPEDLKDDQPLRCKVVDGVLTITIGVKTLAWAAFQAPYRDSQIPGPEIEDLAELWYRLRRDAHGGR